MHRIATTPLRKTLIKSALIVVTLCLVAITQKRSDDFGPPFTTKLTVAKRTLLPSTILPYIHFGFSGFLADIYWIRSIQDFVAWNGKEPYFIGYFENITTLDPRFEYPYLFSIFAIPQRENIASLDAVATIAEKGIDAIPTGWKIPWYLATQYFLFTKNYDIPEHYLAIAASREGAPEGVYLNYATFAARKVPQAIRSEKDYETAKSLVAVIYNNTDNETLKKMASLGIQETLVSQLLERGIDAYKTKFKRYPRSVDELLEVNFITLPKEFQEFFTVVIDQKNGSFKVTAKEE
jgi:hypothetical protein